MLATDLVGRRVAAIVAYTDRAALAAKAATTTIPIVFLIEQLATDARRSPQRIFCVICRINAP